LFSSPHFWESLIFSWGMFNGISIVPPPYYAHFFYVLNMSLFSIRALPNLRSFCPLTCAIAVRKFISEDSIFGFFGPSRPSFVPPSSRSPPRRADTHPLVLIPRTSLPSLRLSDRFPAFCHLFSRSPRNFSLCRFIVTQSGHFVSFPGQSFLPRSRSRWSFPPRTMPRPRKFPDSVPLLPPFIFPPPGLLPPHLDYIRPPQKPRPSPDQGGLTPPSHAEQQATF